MWLLRDYTLVCWDHIFDIDECIGTYSEKLDKIGRGI